MLGHAVAIARRASCSFGDNAKDVRVLTLIPEVVRNFGLTLTLGDRDSCVFAPDTPRPPMSCNIERTSGDIHIFESDI